MPFEENIFLHFNQYLKSSKTIYLIHADLESLIKNINACKINLRKTSATKVGKHILRAYSVRTIWAFDNIENKHNAYRGKDCIKKFCESLKEYVIKTINFEKKEMIPLTNREFELYASQEDFVTLSQKLQITAVIRLSTEVLHITYLI